MAKSVRGPHRTMIYGITAGLLAFGFVMMAVYDTGPTDSPQRIASAATPPR